MGSPVADKDTLAKFYKGSGFGGQVQPASNGGQEAAPAPHTVSHPESERGRMGGMSNQAYPRRMRMTTR